MSQQFKDTGPTSLPAATGDNNHDAHKRSPKIVATKFLVLYRGTNVIDPGHGGVNRGT
jgi:N-acetylmuramoyl-L-alanine amidase